MRIYFRNLTTKNTLQKFNFTTFFFGGGGGILEKFISCHWHMMTFFSVFFSLTSKTPTMLLFCILMFSCDCGGDVILAFNFQALNACLSTCPLDALRLLPSSIVSTLPNERENNNNSSSNSSSSSSNDNQFKSQINDLINSVCDSTVWGPGAPHQLLSSLE